MRRGILHTELKNGKTIALVGAGGGLGYLGCHLAEALGLVVAGISASAKESGADMLIHARQKKEKAIEEVKRVTNGLRVDATVNVSDNPEAGELTCAVTKMHGTLIQIAQVGLLVAKVGHASRLLDGRPKSPFPSTNLSSGVTESKALSHLYL